MAHFQEAMSRYEDLENAAGVADVLWELGLTYRAWGKFAESVEYLTRSREAYEKLEQARNVAALWSRLGVTYREWGKYDEAVAHFQEAMRCLERMDDELNYAHVVSEIGVTYRESGRLEDSRVALQSGLAIYDRHNDNRGLIRNLRYQALTLIQQGDVAKARIIAYRGLELAKLSDLLWETAQCQEAAAEVHMASHDYGAAREHYQVALSIYQKLGSQLCAADAQSGLGMVEKALGNSATAAKLLENAIVAYTQLNRRVKLAKALREVAGLHRGI